MLWFMYGKAFDSTVLISNKPMHYYQHTDFNSTLKIQVLVCVRTARWFKTNWQH